MKVNVGSVDRIVRVVLGLVIIAAGIKLHAWWGALGALPLLTGVFAVCPAYLPFGLSTCAPKAPAKK